MKLNFNRRGLVIPVYMFHFFDIPGGFCDTDQYIMLKIVRTVYFVHQCKVLPGRELNLTLLPDRKAFNQFGHVGY